MQDLCSQLRKIKQRLSFLESVLSELEGRKYPEDPISTFVKNVLPLIDQANSKLSEGCISAFNVLQYGRNPRLINDGITAAFLEFVLDANDFEIVKDEIGRGPYSIVSLGKRKSDEKLYAVKSLTICRRHVDAYEPLYRELEILTRMHHKTVLPLAGFTIHPDFMTVTPYMPLGSIEDALKSRVELNEVQNLKVVFGVAVAMQYLHSQNVIHRDLKPANVFLDEHREPVVADFGLSKLLTSDISGFDPLTASRKIGTPIYSAPEILVDDSYTKKSDVYSYAMLVFRLLCDTRPFANITDFNDLRKRVAAGERPILPPVIPGSYRELIVRCWSQDPCDRPSFSDIVTRIMRDGFPGASSPDFLAYSSKVACHSVASRVLQSHHITFAHIPNPRRNPRLEIADSGPHIDIDSPFRRHSPNSRKTDQSGLAQRCFGTPRQPFAAV
jgi:serine/threonine protein kinase